MDISFECGTCGKHLVVNEAGAGISIDCPGCGKPVYVPNPTSQSQSAPPTRVEIKSTSRKPAPINPLVPSFSSQRKSDVHPSIDGGIYCLIILAMIQTVGFVLVRQNFLWSGIIIIANMPFVIAPILCGVYGMCIGHVKHGLLLVSGVALILGLSYWLTFSPFIHPMGGFIDQLR
jgi:predicted RNA-binding Zn-ribbon protein involved in translation (DUF1610 family)